MRLVIFLLALLISPPAWTAPICLNRAGDAVHCEAKGAMPLGWQLPADEAARRKLRQTPPSARAILKAVGGLALLFALIALMPEFDGARDSDWDPQEKRGSD